MEFKNRATTISDEIETRVLRVQQTEDAWVRMNDLRGQAMVAADYNVLGVIDNAMNVCAEDMHDECVEIGRLISEARRIVQ